MLTFSSQSESDTQRLGAALGAVLPPGTTVALVGPLGAGKTRLVQAVAESLGVPPRTVTSPTFVLLNEYTGGRLPIFHFDTYRLKDDEFLNLGPDEYFDSQGLTFVEWADRVAHIMPAERIVVTFEVMGETARCIIVSGTSPRMEQLANEVALHYSSRSLN